MGYEENFIEGYNILLPTLGAESLENSLEQGKAYDYTHFSIVMNRERKIATFTAHNIDGKNLVSVPRSSKWKHDSRVGKYQLGDEIYNNNPWDRGHLVRRTAVAWGKSASQASNDTFHYTNAAPQHQNFNQDEWLALEDWVLDKADKAKQRLSVFTGPIFRDDDLEYRDILIPAAFWKIAVLCKPSQELSTVAFLMKQNEMWNDGNGKKFLNLKLYQVPVSLIEDLADLQFTFEPGSGISIASDDKYLRRFDPLAATIQSDEEHPWPVIKSADDIVV